MSNYQTTEEEELWPAAIDPEWPEGAVWVPPLYSRRDAIKSWMRYYGLGLLVLGVLVASGAYLVFDVRSEMRDADKFSEFMAASERTSASDTESAKASASVPGRSTSILTVDTAPGGAVVLLDEDTLGTTPLRGQAVETGVYFVSIRKENYASVDTVLIVHEDDSLPQLFFALDPEESADGASLASAFTAPPRTDGRVGAPVPSEPQPAQKKTDSSTSEVHPISGDRETGYRLSLPEDESPEPSPQAVNDDQRVAPTGALSVLVRPWGSIYIDGRLKQRNTDVRYSTPLKAGRYVLRVEHPALGVREQVVEIRNGETQHLVLDLSERQDAE